MLNFDAPRTLETYLHRIGRTARAGESGVAVSLISDEDRALLKDVVKKGRVTLKQRVVPPQVRSLSLSLVICTAYSSQSPALWAAVGCVSCSSSLLLLSDVDIGGAAVSLTTVSGSHSTALLLLLLQAMARWQATIEAAEPDVERVLAEEHEEAAIRRAEMEANKAAVRCESCSLLLLQPDCLEY